MNMTVFSKSVAWVIIASNLVSSASEAKMRFNLKGRADAILASQEKARRPGCAVGIYRDGRTIYEGAYGLANIEHNVRINPQNTVFEIGSVSKQFTAASVLLLVQEGKLAVTDDVRKYIPEVPDFGHTITIDNLLHHTSGLRDFPALRWMRGDSWWSYQTEQDFLDLLARQRGLNFDPGTRHMYSNTNYVLLALIVQKVSGKTLEVFARERIFVPLGMNETYFSNALGRITPHLASGYATQEGGALEARSSHSTEYGDAGVKTTLRDLAKWQRNFEEPKVGGAWLIQQLEQKGTLNDATRISYARGLEVHEEGSGYRGLRTIVHNGGTWDGYRASAMRFPRYKFSSVLLCNSDDGAPVQVRNQIVDLFMGDSLPPRPTPTPPTVPPDARPINEVPSSLMGTYWNKEDINVRRIEVIDGKLWYVRSPTSRSQLVLLPDGNLQMLSGSDRTIIELVPSNGSPQIIRFMSGAKAQLQRVEPPLTDSRALEDYGGTYFSEELASKRFVISVNDGKLVLIGSLEGSTNVTPVFKDGFEFEGGEVMLLFQRDASGRVISATVDHLWARNVVFTRIPQ